MLLSFNVFFTYSKKKLNFQIIKIESTTNQNKHGFLFFAFLYDSKRIFIKYAYLLT